MKEEEKVIRLTEAEDAVAKNLESVQLTARANLHVAAAEFNLWFVKTCAAHNVDMRLYGLERDDDGLFLKPIPESKG